MRRIQSLFSKIARPCFILTLLPLLNACGGMSNIQLADPNDKASLLPSNYVDARAAERKHSHQRENSSYYADDHLSPSLATLFLQKLHLRMGEAIGSGKVSLTRAEVVVTVPDFKYPLQGGPLMLLTEPKYVRVDIAGQINEKDFSHGITNTVYAGPTEGDIRKTIESAIDQTISVIQKDLVAKSGQKTIQAN